MDQSLCLEFMKIRRENEYQYKHPYHKYEIYKRPSITQGLIRRVNPIKLKEEALSFIHDTFGKNEHNKKAQGERKIKYKRLSADFKPKNDANYKKAPATSPLYFYDSLSPWGTLTPNVYEEKKERPITSPESIKNLEKQIKGNSEIEILPDVSLISSQLVPQSPIVYPKRLHSLFQYSKNLPLRLDSISKEINERLKIDGKSASLSPRSLKMKSIEEKLIAQGGSKKATRVSIRLFTKA
ncbi:unnamed protein product [Blepharisma stoltei]|uniref:Uncharacterized protein n=1 Tax=Blepharisma stoltei TaxID=1481888 RepID=A0AAU9IBN5_9CILI|nr:unnamed protein product [Blepharisma stoltei]